MTRKATRLAMQRSETSLRHKHPRIARLAYLLSALPLLRGCGDVLTHSTRPAHFLVKVWAIFVVFATAVVLGSAESAMGWSHHPDSEHGHATRSRGVSRCLRLEALEPRHMMAHLAGDFDLSGVVDQTDYTVWKAAYGQIGESPADGNGNAAVDAK